MFMPGRKLLERVAIAAVVMLGQAASGWAHHMVVRVNLEEMTVRADRIFVGQCIAVDETYQMVAQGNLPVTVYTFEVEQAIKGNVPRRLAITELGHSTPGSPKGHVMMHGQAVSSETLLHGATGFQVGDQALLFLVPNYLGGKITQPVGLYQGAFRVTQLPSGQRLARNSINNLGLFSAPFTGSAMSRADATVVMPEQDNPIADVAGLSTASKALAAKRGSLPLDSLVEIVDKINVSHGNQKGAILQ